MKNFVQPKSIKPLFVINKNNGSTNEIVFLIFDSFEKKNNIYSIDYNTDLNINTLEELRQFIGNCLFNNIPAKKFSNINTLVNSLTCKLFKAPTNITNVNQEIILTDMFSFFIASKRYLAGNYNFNVNETNVEFTYNFGSVLVPEIDTQIMEFNNPIILNLEINGNIVLLFKHNEDISIRLFD